jgi:GNAT superfamily N-acetyltransferase
VSGDASRVTHRAAIPADAQALHELRLRSILELAPHGMSLQQAREWADKGSLESMVQRLEKTEAWVAEVGEKIVGWVAIRDDYLDALYVDPNNARTGIGTELLEFVENVLRRRGVCTIRADASLNSVGFYVRRGYEPLGPGSPDARRPVRKSLVDP